MLPAAEQERRRSLLARLALMSTALVVIVVLASAYLRLANAGLGCADWPQCYGRLQSNEAVTVPLLQTLVRGTHRLAAMIVSVLNLLIAYLCWTREPHSLSTRGSAVIIVALTIFLSLLGRATKGAYLPVVTLGNLLGGLALLGSLWFVWLSSTSPPGAAVAKYRLAGRAKLNLALVVFQIALGALLTARFSGPSCSGFPDCNGTWWPAAVSWMELNPFRALQYHPDGTIVTTPAMQVLNMLHRAAAVLVVCSAALLAFPALRERAVQRAALGLLVATAFAVGVGIAAAQSSFPLAVVLAHNAAASLLLLASLAMYYRVSSP